MLNPQLVKLGLNARVSGSLLLDGSENWDTEISIARLRKRWKRNRLNILTRRAQMTLEAQDLTLSSVHEFGSLNFRCAVRCSYNINNHHNSVEIHAQRLSLYSDSVKADALQIFYVNQAQIRYDTSSVDGAGFIQFNSNRIPCVMSNKTAQLITWAVDEWYDIGVKISSLGSSILQTVSERLQKQREDRRKKLESSMSTFILTVSCNGKLVASTDMTAKWCKMLSVILIEFCLYQNFNYW